MNLGGLGFKLMGSRFAPLFLLLGRPLKFVVKPRITFTVGSAGSGWMPEIVWQVCRSAGSCTVDIACPAELASSLRRAC